MYSCVSIYTESSGTHNAVTRLNMHTRARLPPASTLSSPPPFAPPYHTRTPGPQRRQTFPLSNLLERFGDKDGKWLYKICRGRPSHLASLIHLSLPFSPLNQHHLLRLPPSPSPDSSRHNPSSVYLPAPSLLPCLPHTCTSLPFTSLQVRTTSLFFPRPTSNPCRPSSPSNPSITSSTCSPGSKS